MEKALHCIKKLTGFRDKRSSVFIFSAVQTNWIWGKD